LNVDSKVDVIRIEALI